MNFAKVAAFVLICLPSLASASQLLNASEMKFLVKNCLAHFAQQTGHPVKIDKNRLLKMGFSISRDETFIFKAQRVIKEGDYIFAKERFGPAIEIDRNRRKPDDVKYWTCNITTGDTVKTDQPHLSGPV